MTLTPSLPPADPTLSPEVRWYLESRGYSLPELDRAPLIRTPEPCDFTPEPLFLADRVDKVIAALRCLQHTKGKWAGRPLDPAPWQVAYIIAPIFGWFAPGDPDPETGKTELVRIVRNAFIEMPRKGGKTTLSAGLSMYLAFADGESGAEVLLGAGSRDQARMAFSPLSQLAKTSFLLKRAGVRALVSSIVQDASGSGIRVVSSRAELTHGANVHGGLVDELWAHKSPDLLDAIESGTGAREQPLVIIITMADEDSKTSVYAQRRHMIEQIAERIIKVPSMYGIIFAAGDKDSPYSEDTWRRANPNYPVSPTPTFMTVESSKARANPVDMARFKRIHLGIRSAGNKRYIDLDKWARNASMVDPVKLKGRQAFGGIDLGSVSDLTALCWLFPDDDRGGYDVLWHFWLPSEALPGLNERTQHNAAVWVERKFITLTPGEVTDYDWIKSQVMSDLSTYQVQAIGYDRWNSSQCVIDLNAQGAPMVAVGQGFATMSAPTKQLDRLVRLGTVERPMMRHGGNPVALWMAANLRVDVDAADNHKPNKATSMDKIDGMSALITALALAMPAEEPKTSAYEDDRLSVV